MTNDTAAPATARPFTLPERFKDRLALRMSEVSKLCGISSRSVKTAILRGELVARRIGSGEKSEHFIVPVPALEAWLQGERSE